MSISKRIKPVPLRRPLWKKVLLCTITAFLLYVEIILLMLLKIDWARSRAQEWPRYLESLSLFWIEACFAAAWTQLLAVCICELGAKIQINAYSLFEEMDDSIKNWARRLVLERKVDFLGTDAHRTCHRPPSAAMGLNWLYENVARDYADAIAWKNAQKLLCQ